jgi:hypothetical protein
MGLHTVSEIVKSDTESFTGPSNGVKRRPARRFPAEPLTLADMEALRAACSRRANRGAPMTPGESEFGSSWPPATVTLSVTTLGSQDASRRHGISRVGKFASADQVAAYVGLVPRARSSGAPQRRGPLTKAGNSRVRWLLVQAAWAYWRSRATAGTVLRAWVERLAGRRGRLRAVVALARPETRERAGQGPTRSTEAPGAARA